VTRGCRDSAGLIARRVIAMDEPGAVPPARRRLGSTRLVAVTLGLVASVGASLAVATSPAAALPDGRSWEMVSPVNKDGASIDPLGFGFGGLIGGLITSSEDGNSITYVADAPVTPEPEGNRAIEGNQVFSQRSPTGWSAKDIVTPHKNGEGLVSGPGQEYRLFSMDLARGVVTPFTSHNPFQEPPLVNAKQKEEENVKEEVGIYLRQNFACEAGAPTCFEAVVNPENNVAGNAFGEKLEFNGASADLSHLVFKSEVALTPGAGAEGMYEWNAERTPSEPEHEHEQLQFVSRLPAKPGVKAKAAFDPQLGNNVEKVSDAARNAVSSNGSRVFFSALKSELAEVRNLYMRDVPLGTTMRINAQEGFAPVGAKGEVHYQTASTDGSRVFFTDTSGLTSHSLLKGKEASPADLYVCEVEGPGTGETCPAGKLTDLTGAGEEGMGFSGPGDVVGAVLGTSENGSSVYFVANGSNTAGPAGPCGPPDPETGKVENEQSCTGTCPRPNTAEEVANLAERSCHLYVAHNSGSGWEKPKPIALLSAADAPDWAREGARLSNLTARVSPSGQFLAFMSERPLTGYDNRDESAAAGNARDEEVFLYNDATGTPPVCASCNPNPEKRPTGVFDTVHSGEGSGLIVDPFSQAWEGHWLAASIPGWTSISTVDAPYQSRYLLDSGRLYFNSADALVPADKNHRSETIPQQGGEAKTAEVGVEDVYQFEPEGIGSCAPGSGACVSLLSSGESPRESAFLDASADGDNVFFLTPQALVSTDHDSVADVYDARVCTEASPCLQPPPPPTPPCDETPERPCRSATSATVPGFGGTGSETVGPPSVAKVQTQGVKTVVKPKPLTRAQKLTRALKQCNKRFKHSKKKLAACKKQAYKKYGPKKSSKHKAAKK
jgi:hypothetical protein